MALDGYATLADAQRVSVRALSTKSAEESDQHMSQYTRFEYTYGLSFPGSITTDLEGRTLNFRNLVGQVADLMTASCGNDQSRVLYDQYHQGEFARPSLDEYLPAKYRHCELIIVFLCKDYADRHWCKREWTVISQLARDVDHRHRVMFLWHGEVDHEVLSSLGLSWGQDGLFDITMKKPKKIWDEVYNRYISVQKKQLREHPAFKSTPFAADIGLPLDEPKTKVTAPPKLVRLALVVHKFPHGYVEDGRYCVSFCIQDDTSETYHLFTDLNTGLEFLDLTTVCEDWALIAQSIVNWTCVAARGDSLPLVELFLPIEILQKLAETDFLNVPCKTDPRRKNCVSFGSYCSVVFRPLDRYVQEEMIEDLIHLKRKYSKLSNGHGKWILDKAAESCDALAAGLHSPDHVAIRMVNDLPSPAWIDAMIASMVPLALWWAMPGQNNRNEHLADYKSACGSRSLLEAGIAGQIGILPEDLYHLPIQRRLFNHEPAARSLVLMIDNPYVVPEFLVSTTNQNPFFTARSMA